MANRMMNKTRFWKMIYMTRTRDEGVLSIKKVEEDKMNKMTIRKKVMLLVAAGMAMQSMGLTVYAKEITEPTDFTSTVKQTQSKEDVLADAILQAQDAVKSKKALLLEAQAELDKVQPKYDVTKQAYEQASYKYNQMESSVNSAVLDAMKSNLQDIKNKKKDLDQVALEKANAEKAKKEAEDTYNKAVSDLEKAQKSYDEAVKNVSDSSFKEDVEKAKQAIEDAKNAVMQAQIELNDAKTQQEELSSKVSECEAALSDAQNKLQEALDAKVDAENTLTSLQQQLSEANGKDNSEKIQVIQNEIQNLELEVNNYNSKIESINSEVATLQSSLSKAQMDLDIAKSKVEEAKSNYDTKVEEQNEAQAKMDEMEEQATLKDGEIAKLQEAVELARTKFEEAKAKFDAESSQLNDKKAAVEAAQKKLESLNDAYQDALNQWNQGSYGYFKSIHAEYPLYMMEDENLTNKNNLYECKLGADTDPTNLDNMIATIDYIKQCNALRKQNGLNELKVDLSLVVIAQIDASGNIAQLEHNSKWTHLGLYNCGENIAYGPKYYNPFKGWYDSEYKLYQDAIASGKYPNLENMTSMEVYSTWPDLWEKIGHYYNILDERYNYTGFALGQTVKVNPGCNDYSQTFGLTGSDYTMTVDEYEKSLTSYVNGLKDVFKQHEQALEEYTKANEELLKAQKEMATYKTVEEAQQTYLKALDDLSNGQAEFNTFMNGYLAQQKNLEQAKANVQTALDAIDLAKSQQEAIENQIHDLNSSISNKMDALSATKESAAQAQKSIQDKEAEIQKLNQSKLDVDKIKANISKQESIVKDKTDAWQLALNEVDNRQSELESAEKDLNNQLVVVDEKKGVLKDKEIEFNKREEDYQNLLKLNQNVNDAFANLENAKNAVVKAETVKTDLATKVKKLEKALDQLTMEYTKLNSEKDKVDSLVACYNNLKEKKLDTEVLTIDGYESICTLLKQYKAALLDLNEKKQVYQEVKDKFDVLNTAYQKAKADYDQAIIQETNVNNDLKKHLEESKKEVEKKQNDTKQSSSVNTGVQTAIASLSMTTVLGAAGAVVATRKLSRKEKHAKK